MHDTPIFARTYDMIAWLLPVTARFPRCRRHSLTERIENAALDMLQLFILANGSRGAERARTLREADGQLQYLLFLLRLAVNLGDLSRRQHGHMAARLAEIGKLLGGWLASTRE